MIIIYYLKRKCIYIYTMYTVYFWDEGLTLLETFINKESALKSLTKELEKFLNRHVTEIVDKNEEEIRIDVSLQDGLYLVKDKVKDYYNLIEKTTNVGMIFIYNYVQPVAKVGVAPMYQTVNSMNSSAGTGVSQEQWAFVDEVKELMQKSTGSNILPSKINK